MFQFGVFIWQWRPLWSWWAGGEHEAGAGGYKEGCLPFKEDHSASLVTSSLVKSPSFHREHSSARGSQSLTQNMTRGWGFSP